MKRSVSLLSFLMLSVFLMWSPATAEAKSCPKNCVSWYDGCNTCGCKNGRITYCTKRACKKRGRAYCKKKLPKLTCKNIKCPKFRYCKMIGSRPKCVCRKVAIRCARGYITAYKKAFGCRIPYCKKVYVPPKRCPKNCVSWYDGCNTCGCKNGRITYCTKRACKKPGRAYCKKKMPKPTKGCPKNCASWYDGCNTCVCKNGRKVACTKRYCIKPSRPYCKKKK